MDTGLLELERRAAEAEREFLEASDEILVELAPLVIAERLENAARPPSLAKRVLWAVLPVASLLSGVPMSPMSEACQCLQRREW